LTRVVEDCSNIDSIELALWSRRGCNVTPESTYDSDLKLDPARATNGRIDRTGLHASIDIRRAGDTLTIPWQTDIGRIFSAGFLADVHGRAVRNA
jgi:hypothetical protein